jgi:hypothetical protein
MMQIMEQRKETYKGKTYTTWHGSPFDRGSADSWYSRPQDPHWYPEGSYKGIRVNQADMTPEEVEAYHAGYQQNEESGGKKEW